MQEGIEAEERGERTAYGDKARRNYEEALRCYQASVGLAMAVGQESVADAAYNAARILYLLADGFYMPHAAFNALQASVELYKQAGATVSNSTSGSAGDRPSEFELDIASNMATSLQAMVDILIETPEAIDLSEQQAHNHIIAVANEARDLFDNVAAEQEKVLALQLQDEVTADAQAIHLGAEPSIAPPPVEGVQQSDPRMPAEGSSTSVYASSLIVPSSLLDTYSSLYEVAQSMIGQVTESSQLQQVQEQTQAILQKAQSFVHQCHSANNWGDRASPDDEWAQGLSMLERNQGETAIAIVTQLASLSDVAKALIQSEATRLAQGILPRLQGIPGQRLEWDQQAADLPESRKRNHYQRKVDEAVSTANQAISLSRLLSGSFIQSQSQDESPAAGTVEITFLLELLRMSWTLATGASAALQFVLTFLDTGAGGSGGGAAVLGSSSMVNPTKLQRCSIFTTLSEICLLRAHPRYNALSSPAVVSESSRCTILDNARVYAKRSLGEVGLSWVLDPPGLLDGSGSISASAVRRLLTEKAKDVPPRGWSAVEVQAEALLHTARAIFHRSNKRPTPPATDEGEQELERLAAAVRSLVHGGQPAQEELIAQGWRLALDPQRWVNSLLHDDREGKADRDIDEREQKFWEQWSSMLIGG